MNSSNILEYIAGVSLLIFSLLAIIHWLSDGRLRREKILQLQVAKNRETLQTNSQTINQLKYDLETLSAEKERKDQIISIVVHDLKSPLRFLSLHMKNLQDNFKDLNAEELAHYALLLKNTVNETYYFTQEILLWFNDQNGYINIIKKETDLQELVYNTARLYQDICLAKNNQIEICILPNIKINTAADLLHVIIRNLLDDANKFTKNGKITISAYVKDTLAYITITDTGIGMTEDKIIELINPDKNNWKEKASGNYLGYKIINNLIMKLGGSIKILSELKKGTSVTVLIPAF